LLVAHLFKNIGQITFAAARRRGRDVEKVPRTTSRNQRTRFDQGLTRTLSSLHRNESGDEPSFVSNAKFLAGFNPGEVSRCVLP
jgi:hypothetical protein